MVAAIMRERFQVFGLTRSYADFYRGMGLGITIALTMEALVLWMLASLAKTDSVRLRPVLAVFLMGYLAFAVNSYLFFFYGPVIAELLIAGCLASAIFTAKPAIESQLETTARMKTA